VTLLAGQAAVAVENARLYESATRWSRQLESLHEVIRSLAGETDLRTLLTLVAARLRELVDARLVLIALPTPDGDLRIEAADGDRADELVGDRLTERLPQQDGEEVDAGAVPCHGCHLTAGDARRDLDHADDTVLADQHLGVDDAHAYAERVHRVHGDPLDLDQRVSEERGGVDMRERDAEARSRRTATVGEGHDDELAAPGDDEPVHLSSLVELLQDRLLRRRLRERGMQVALEIVV
jgi:GAF domain-containing protein